MKPTIRFNTCRKFAGAALGLLAAVLLMPRAGWAQPTTDGLFYCSGDDAIYSLHGIAASGSLYVYSNGVNAYAAMVTSINLNENVFGKDKFDGKKDSFNARAYQDSVGWAGAKHRWGELEGSDHNDWRVTCGPSYAWTQDLVDDTDGDHVFPGHTNGKDVGEADFFATHLGSDGSGAKGTQPAGIIEMSSSAWNANNITYDAFLGGAFDGTSAFDGDPNKAISPINFPANGYPFCDNATPGGGKWEWHLVYEIQFPLSSCGSPISLWVADAHNSPQKNDVDSSSVCSVDCQLPVELVSFTAIENGGDIQLNWTTASETNNAGFSIEHAVDHGFYEEIGYVPGAGTTLERQDYSFRVPKVDPGLHTFRLKQIDLDGAFEYLQTVELSVEVPNAYLLEPAYPNPFNPQASIRFAVKEKQQVTMAMFDATGRQVRVVYKGVPEPNQMQSVRIDGSGLPSGIYIVRLSGASFIASQTVTLVK